MMLLGLALVAATVPYEDPSGRFRFEVAEGFELEPRFGDVDGVRFVRPAPPRRGGGAVVFEVRLAPVDACAGRPVDIHGTAWRRREEERSILFARSAGARCILARVEGSRRARRRTRAAVAAMLGSLRLAERVPAGGPSGRSARPARPPELVGAWVDASGRRLELRAEGRFRLGRLRGVWRTEGEGALVMGPDEGAPRRLEYRLEGRSLVLSGGGLAHPVRYARAEAAGAPALAGTWRRGELVLELASDGTFRLGPWEGRYEVAGERLRLVKGPVDVLDYRFALREDRLVLAGADLDAPVELRRIEAETTGPLGEDPG